MEKTIEQQIAEGIAQGIQKAKEQELELKRQKAQDKGAGIVIFFLTWFFTISIMVMIQVIGIKAFGLSQTFLHGYAYPIIVIIEMGFMILFLREEFKTYPIQTIFYTLFNSFVVGYLISKGF